MLNKISDSDSDSDSDRSKYIAAGDFIILYCPIRL